MKEIFLKLLCKLGFHDWEDVAACSTQDIAGKIINFGNRVYQYNAYGLYKKICLRCEKYVDEMAKYEDEFRKEYNKEQEAKEKREKRLKYLLTKHKLENEKFSL